MTRTAKSLLLASLCISSALHAAPPPVFNVVNNLGVATESYIAGQMTSSTPANSTRSKTWGTIALKCTSHRLNPICPVTIMLATAPKTVLGTLNINIISGEISPKVLSSNGYTMTLNEPATIVFTKN